MPDCFPLRFAFMYSTEYRDCDEEEWERQPRGLATTERFGSSTVETLPQSGVAALPAPARGRGALKGLRDRDGEMDGETETVLELIKYFGDVYSVKIAPQESKKRGRSAPRPSFAEESALLKQKIRGMNALETIPFADFRGDPWRRPIVVKNEKRTGGQEKYLITNREQLARFAAWMDRHGFPEEWVVQPYIESPGDAPSSYRVIADCTGHVITSQLLYGAPRSMNVRLDRKNFQPLDPATALEDPHSGYFLNSPVIASNMMFDVQGNIVGGRATLDRREDSHPYGERDREVLLAHGLREQNPALPGKIHSISENVGIELGNLVGNKVQGALLVGIDVLQDTKGKHHVAEINRRPSMDAVRDYHGSVHAMTKISAWRWTLNSIMTRIKSKQ
jgi:hypothetical protein